MSLQSRYKKETPSTGPLSFNIRTAAEHLGAHEWTIRLAIREGKLRATRIGKARGYNIERAELERWAKTERFSVVRSPPKTKRPKAKLPKLPEYLRPGWKPEPVLALPLVPKSPLDISGEPIRLAPVECVQLLIRRKR